MVNGMAVTAAANAPTLRAFVGLRASGPSARAVSLPFTPKAAARRGQSPLVVRAATALAPKITKVTPLGDRVFVKITEVEEKSSGGILLPSAAVARPPVGEVVAVGAGRPKPDGAAAGVDVKVGDKVVYSKFAGTIIELGDVDHVLLKEEDIIGLLDSDDITTLKPLLDRVLIEVTEADDKTAGGVLLTENAKEKPQTGTVLAAGPGTKIEDGKRQALEVAPGNKVLYSKYSGSDYKGKDGKQYIVVKAQDILAVIA